ncbi:MAG: nucleoside phosphorylase [Alphaproteobacteria bacterium]
MNGARSLGVVTGLIAEAALIAPRHRARATGARPGRAAALAEALLAEGCTMLASFGLAGGIDPRLLPGALVLPNRILDADGRVFETDATWRVRLGALAGAHESGAILGSERALATTADKAHAHARTGALAVDMESHEVARVAHAHGVPFIAVRAVADPAGRGIPTAALHGIAPDGGTRPLAVICATLARPWQLPALLRLAGDSRRAALTLRRVALLGGGALGMDIA